MWGRVILIPDVFRLFFCRSRYRAMEYRKLELDWSIVTKNEKILKELERLCAVDTTTMDKETKEACVILSE